MARTLFLALLVLTTACTGSPPSDSPLLWRVVRVIDGDSIVVEDEAGLQLEVRLEGIDCPEAMQAGGVEATGYTSRLLLGRLVELGVLGHDRYERTLAVVRRSGVNINLELVRTGHAWHYLRYNDDLEFAAAQREARTARRGLWAAERPLAPWVFRRSGRSSGAAAGAGGSRGHAKGDQGSR